MKRIEFIAPVEAMRGNLSGAQKLQYPTDNQGAYDGPAGAVNYARNYSPRFIGAKIAKSGKKYFAVKTKTANHLTAKSKQAMALLAGTGTIVGAILRNKTSETYTKLYSAWVKSIELGGTSTFRQFLSGSVRSMLINKSASYHVQVGEFGQDIYNPWVTTQVTDYNIPMKIILKFWSELAPTGAFVVEVALPDGKSGVCPWISGKTFAQMSEGPVSNGIYDQYGTSIGSMVASGSTAVQYRILPELSANTTLYLVENGQETAVLASANPKQLGTYVIKKNS